MATSQNGYPVPLTLAAQAATLTNITVKGGTLKVRKGDTAVIFAWLFGELTKLENPLWPGCWGFYVRPIRGKSSGYSNHSSGTAFDYSAPRHPRQSTSRYAGWSVSDVAFIHSRLAMLDHVVRWGADYVTKPYDPMHDEINASPAAIARVAAKIRAGQLGGTGAPVTATRVSQSYSGPQAIPAGDAGHLLRVLTGTTNLSCVKGPARCEGVFIVYGTGTPGDTVRLQGVRATLKGTAVTNSGTGWDDVTVGADGKFERVLPVSTDLATSQFLRIMAASKAGCTVTTVVTNIVKG